MEIDKGKRLSVGPSTSKAVLSPVEEMHSLNFVNKVKEFTRIEKENERIIYVLSQAPAAILGRDELVGHQELNKKLSKMLSKNSKNSVE